MSAEVVVIANRYELGQIVGQGAMGVVYHATDLVSDRIVALKALRPEVVAANPTLLTRFQREGEALRLLNHPNIVTMLDAFEFQGRHFLVMEYVDSSLQELLATTPQLPIDRALRIALDLADALTRAHRLHIVHRDIKPANVLLASDGTPRLTDFGIAHMGASSITDAGSVVGTYAYLSPEACMGTGVDARSDIWSFGVMLFEMLAGRRPFEGSSPAALITGILNNPIPDLGDVRGGIPDALQDLLYRMLNRNPDARIPSIRMVGAELEAIIRQIETPVTIPARPLMPAEDDSAFDTPTPSSPGRQYNWPAQITPFVGREAAIEAVDMMIDDPTCRLITLLGPGGMGKTRLALEIASRRLAICSDNIAFVPLAPLTSPEDIVPGIAAAMGVAIDGQGDPKQQLLAYLRSQNLILVLDNFEHVLEGAHIVIDILQVAPAITVLATSRSRLNLQAECPFEVSGMDVPADSDLERLEQNEAARMFLTYARRARPGYELAERERPAVIQICRLLEGMPLGLELAAAWMRTLPPSAIAEELSSDMDFLDAALRDIPERHRGIRAVFEYSWRLLTDEEQAVLKKLSVFRGGFTREAAREIAGARVMTIARLVDQSLLRRDPEGRFWHHELLRQYEAEKLAQNPEDERAVLAAHSRYYASYLDVWRGALRGSKQKDALNAFDAEIDNLRAAWRHGIDHGQPDDLTRYVDDLPSFYDIRGRQREAIELFGWAVERLELKRAAEIQPDGVLRVLYARLTRIVGQTAYRLDQHDRATRLLQKALDIFRTIESSEADVVFIQTETAMCLNNLGNIATATKNYAKARALFEECLAIYRIQNNERGAATVLNNLGTVLKEMEDYSAAIEAYSTSLGFFRSTGNDFAVAVLLDNLGHVSNSMKHTRLARDYFREALPKAWALGSQPLVLDVLSGMAVLNASTEPESAASWAALICGHPASYQESKQRAQVLFNSLAEKLPPDEFANALSAAGKSLDEIIPAIINPIPT